MGMESHDSKYNSFVKYINKSDTNCYNPDVKYKMKMC
jgi:hypothetical protein